MNVAILLDRAGSMAKNADKPFYARETFSTKRCPFVDVGRAEKALDSLGYAIQDLRLDAGRMGRSRWGSIHKAIETVRAMMLAGRNVEIRGKHLWNKDANDWFG